MQVLLRPIARKYFERLNEPDKGYIQTALEGLKKEPPIGDIKPMVGQEGRFRLRVGKYRILFSVTPTQARELNSKEENTVVVTNIEPRGQAYKKKNRGQK
jgi:mRNA-degrading endonuclease RelE of RelBE toxin-antitoxin system